MTAVTTDIWALGLRGGADKNRSALHRDLNLMYVCMLDTNVQLRHGTKRDNYVPLIDQLCRIYPGYTYRIIQIIIGALGTIPRQLSDNLKEIGLSAEAYKRFTEQGQKLTLLGTLKITKNFQKH